MTIFFSIFLFKMRFFMFFTDVVEFCLSLFCAATINKTIIFMFVWFNVIISDLFFSSMKNFSTVLISIMMILTFSKTNAVYLKTNFETTKIIIWKIAVENAKNAKTNFSQFFAIFHTFTLTAICLHAHIKRFFAKKFQEIFLIINMNAIVEKIVVEFWTHAFKNLIVFITIKTFVWQKSIITFFAKNNVHWIWNS